MVGWLSMWASTGLTGSYHGLDKSTEPSLPAWAEDLRAYKLMRSLETLLYVVFKSAMSCTPMIETYACCFLLSQLMDAFIQVKRGTTQLSYRVLFMGHEFEENCSPQSPFTSPFLQIPHARAKLGSKINIQLIRPSLLSLLLKFDSMVNIFRYLKDWHNHGLPCGKHYSTAKEAAILFIWQNL